MYQHITNLKSHIPFKSENFAIATNIYVTAFLFMFIIPLRFAQSNPYLRYQILRVSDFPLHFYIYFYRFLKRYHQPLLIVGSNIKMVKKLSYWDIGLNVLEKQDYFFFIENIYTHLKYVNTITKWLFVVLLCYLIIKIHDTSLLGIKK